MVDRAATLDSSSQAPAACSASVCEIKLVMNVGVNLFFLDQMVKALLKYRLETPQEQKIIFKKSY